MPSLDFDKEKNRFREFYTDNHHKLIDGARLYEGLINALISKDNGIAKPTVTFRVKDREESIRKFARKYQTILEDKQEQYEIKDHITDLVGLRVTCIYESDVQEVVKLLKENFILVEETDKSAELEAKENVFGYKGHHLDLKINEERAGLPEYDQYKALQFEVQVRSTIQDAWSVLDHKIKYKKMIPHTLKRQINALAALFEIADREFTTIKEETYRLKQEKEDAKDANEYIDVFAFLQIANSYFKDYNFIDYKADGFLQEIVRRDSSMTIAKMKQIFSDHMEMIKNYSKYQDDELGNELNPYTRIRHALYLSDTEKFRLILYDNQRGAFDKWVKDQREQAELE
ncbi:GTP pyrophosphokinase [Maridesulfovibrio sp.]|uniref:GTP pyrophosphokinase n=1 Tax=Maridesulfovibrio sp. TaxID=2795000 RepID=UPI003AFFE6A7